MRPYRYCCKRFLNQGTLRQKTWIFLRLVWEDIVSVWLLELPFPTSIKIVITAMLGLVVILFLSVPLIIFLFSVTSFDHILCPLYSGGWKSSVCYPYLTLLLNVLKFGTNTELENGRRGPSKRSVALLQETLLRGLLVGNTVATSVDYMHMVRRFINNALP